MTELITTSAVCVMALLVLVLAIMGSTIIWWLPPYGRFKALVTELERAHVTSVSLPEPNMTLGMIGRRRIPEIFDTTVAVPDGLFIRQGFGAMFFKELGITETIDEIQYASGLLVLGTFVGVCILAITDATLVKALPHATLMQLVPLLADALLKNHLILGTEVVVILTGLMYLIHNGRVIKKLIADFEPE